MLRKLLLKLGYVKKDRIEKEILKIMNEIKSEIQAWPQYPNIGKKGCLKRLTKFYDKELK
jgi:hypothetical protein